MGDTGFSGIINPDVEARTSSQETVFARACAFARARLVGTGDPDDARAYEHALGTVDVLRELDVDDATLAAAMLFGAPGRIPAREVGARFGDEVLRLVDGMRQIRKLREIHRGLGTDGADAPEAIAGAHETLRRMLLAMALDIRVVLLRLASRLRTLRHHAALRRAPETSILRETLDVIAPLANRLGLWQLKWELEDLAFRFLMPEAYRSLAAQIEERRVEREQFVVAARARLEAELRAAGVGAEVTGRPKHLYSIYNKMHGKRLSLVQIQDLRGLRVIVDSVDDCYAALGVIHALWQPIPQEYDDYIARPKPNGYQSLHTVVVAGDGRPLEVQVRTREMHRHAEFGVASHWRYKEGRQAQPVADARHDEQIAWMRQLLGWQREVGKTLGSGAIVPSAGRIYVLTPQARVIELPEDATPVDFAYHVHTTLGHRCRGAKVDGVMVALTTRLANGQTVEILTARDRDAKAGPSRDWLNPSLGYVRSARARAKVRQWFNALDLERDLELGRERAERAMQREGRTAVGFDELAARLGFGGAQELFLALAREEVGTRALEQALRPPVAAPSGVQPPSAGPARRPVGRPAGAPDVLVAGVGSLLTQLARCCRPAPPDAIVGFVTRGSGVSVHRRDCETIARLSRRAPERLIETTWPGAGKPAGGGAVEPIYEVDVEVEALDRQGLLRDVSEVFAKQRVNVVAVKTQSRADRARMRFTIEVSGAQMLDPLLARLRAVNGVSAASRR